MALSGLNWHIINKNLFVEGAKYWRTGYFNRKTGEEKYICSEAKKSKCPCTALVRYVPKELISETISNDSQYDIFGNEDLRLLPEKFEVVLVWASQTELHERYHEIDLIDAKCEEMKESMTEVMMKDPTLEPSTVIDKVVHSFTETLDGNSEGKLTSAFYGTKQESHLRSLRRVK